MEEQKLFSLTGTGYDKKEVDDYISFLQTELTMNMKKGRDSDQDKEIALKEVETLKSEVEKLKTKNGKLYKDCVAFAKKLKNIQDSQVYVDTLKEQANLDEEKEKLNDEVTKLREQIASLQQENDTLRNTKPEFVGEFQDIDSGKDEETVVAPFTFEKPVEESVEEQIEYTPTPVNAPEEKEVKSQKKDKTKGSNLRIFVKTLFTIILVISLIISIISGIAYLFSTYFPNTTIGGLRCYTVLNDAQSPAIDHDDIVVVKRCNAEGLPLDSQIVTTKDGRSVGKLTGVDVNGDSISLTVVDKNSKYQIDSSELIGKVSFKISFLGKVANYAIANRYNYFAIVVSITLFSLAVLLLIPSGKAKAPKFGKDYTVEDFTI